MLPRNWSSLHERITDLLYADEHGRRRQKSLGHANHRKAKRQRAQFERKLIMGIVEPGSMKLKDFVEDSLKRTGDQIRESTHRECRSAMEDFIRVVGNRDYRQVSLSDAECYRQRCLDKGLQAIKPVLHVADWS